MTTPVSITIPYPPYSEDSSCLKVLCAIPVLGLIPACIISSSLHRKEMEAIDDPVRTIQILRLKNDYAASYACLNMILMIVCTLVASFFLIIAPLACLAMLAVTGLHTYFWWSAGEEITKNLQRIIELQRSII